MVTPVKWSPPAAAGPLPQWTPPDDSLAGLDSAVDTMGRPVAGTGPVGPAPRRVSNLSADQQLDQIAEEELQNSIAQADAQLEQEGRAPGPMDMIAGQMAGSQQAYGDALSAYLLNQPKHGSKANPKAPFVQRRAAERHGSMAFEYPEFAPEPYDAPPQHEGESDADYAERVQLFADMDTQLQRESYDRQRAEAEAQAGTLTPETNTRQIGQAGLGFEEAYRQGSERETAAMQAQADDVAREEAIAAQKQADATAEMARVQEDQAAREQAGMEARQHLVGVREQARKNLAAMPELNRDRVAKGLSTGTKIAAVLGAIAQGWRGDAVTAVTDAIDRGVQEEMDKYARRSGEYQAVVDEADDAMNFLDFTVNSLGGSVRAGQSMLRSARMEDAIAELKAKEAAAATPVIREQLMNTRVKLEEQLRVESDAQDLEAITTPERIGFSIDTPARRLAREEARAIMKDSREEQRDLRKMGVQSIEKEADRAGALELEGAKSAGAVAAKTAEKDAEWDQEVKKRTMAMGAAETAIDDFLAANTGNIHGRGLPGTGESDQRIDTDSFRTALKLQITQAFTGATATPEQQEAFDRLVDGDWSELSDDAMRARLRSLKGILASQRKYMQRPLQTPDAQIKNPRELSSFKSR